MRFRFLLVVPLVFLVACSGTKGRLRGVRSARAAAAVGGVKQVQQYAAAVESAYKAGDYRKHPGAGIADADAAIREIDRVVPTAGVDASTLVAWRGVVLAVSGREQDAMSDFERSLAMGPTNLPRQTWLKRTVGRTAPTLSDPYARRPCRF